eukprot:702255-Pelagomonas_calceolata.AAC.5
MLPHQGFAAGIKGMRMQQSRAEGLAFLENFTQLKSVPVHRYVLAAPHIEQTFATACLYLPRLLLNKPLPPLALLTAPSIHHQYTLSHAPQLCP